MNIVTCTVQVTIITIRTIVDYEKKKAPAYSKPFIKILNIFIASKDYKS